MLGDARAEVAAGESGRHGRRPADGPDDRSGQVAGNSDDQHRPQEAGARRKFALGSRLRRALPGQPRVGLDLPEAVELGLDRFDGLPTLLVDLWSARRCGVSSGGVDQRIEYSWM
jgi:hypothetical protein